MNLIQKKKDYRLNVSIEILLIMLVSSNFLDINFFRPLIRDNMNVVSYLLLLAYTFIRNMGFSFRFGIAHKLKPMWWLIIGVLISFIPAYLYYGQHFYNSLTAYRHFLGYFAFFLFLSIQPSREEFKKALYVFSLFYILTAVYCTYLNRDFVFYSTENTKPFLEDGEFIHFLPGSHFLTIAYIFALSDLRNKKLNSKSFLIPVLLLGAVFIIQNRKII